MINLNNEKPKIVSDNEIREALVETLIEYESTAISECLNKYNPENTVFACFFRGGYHVQKLEYQNQVNAGQNETKVANYKVSILDQNNMDANNVNNVKQFATNYVKQVTNFDLIDLHTQLEDARSCKYPELQHKLAIWIISNFARLCKQGILCDPTKLRLKKYGNELADYLLTMYNNHWEKLDQETINCICQVLEKVAIKKSSRSLIIKGLNHAELALKKDPEYYYLIELAVHYNESITIPITELGNLFASLWFQEVDKLRPMTLITQNKKDTIKLINYLTSVETDDILKYLKSLQKHGSQFKTNGFGKIYQVWYETLQKCPAYKDVKAVNNTITALKIMFPQYCK